MKSASEWQREKEVFKLTDEQLAERIQAESYNSGVRDAIKNIQLLSTSGGASKPIGKKYEIYSPSFGMKTITIDEQSLLRLLKPE